MTLRASVLAFSPLPRHRALASYGTKLRRYLLDTVGWRTTYSPDDVRRGVSQLGLSVDHICYAYALFLTPQDFDWVHHERGETCDYTTMHDRAIGLLGECNDPYESPASTTADAQTDGHSDGHHHASDHSSDGSFTGGESGGFDGGE